MVEVRKGKRRKAMEELTIVIGAKVELEEVRKLVPPSHDTSAQ